MFLERQTSVEFFLNVIFFGLNEIPFSCISLRSWQKPQTLKLSAWLYLGQEQVVCKHQKDMTLNITDLSQIKTVREQICH